ncbi:hypothetical protein VaNZ11_015289 [Volvox africanus]|uniref:Flagellar associated protein n=1 Tax=Volvox africanus TaxID=51714 RepID=A0ABQ5SLM5_9CHLO|nr:hypothetical protein VaNZ11_015289 [Volvox africanus]
MKAEELYLEELWKEDEEEEERLPPALHQDMVQHQQDNALPSYHELMGSGAMAVSLHHTKAATAAAAQSPMRPTNRRPSSSNGISGGGGGVGDESPPISPVAAWEEPPRLALEPTIGADPEQLKRRLQSVVKAVNANQERYEEVLLEANKATDLVRSMEAEISSLQREAEELSRRLPPAPERQRQVETWLSQRSAALEAQKGVQSSRQLELIAAEAALRAAERELDYLAEAKGEVEAAQASETANAEATANELRAREERAVAGYKRRQATEAARLAAAQQEAEEASRRRLEAAEEARQKVLARMASERTRLREGVAANQQRLVSEQGRRREAVLGLKSSMAAVRADVARQAELAAALQRQRREVQEKEFGALVEAGLNPYEVFRRRDQQEEAKRQHANIQSNIASRQLDLAAQLAREQEAYQRALAARQKGKMDRVEFDREMGVAARQARTDEYMRTHTLAGTTMLDPTGRLPVFPSQATVVKDARFGQGTAPPELLSKQLARLGPEVPKQLLLPAKYRNAEADAVAGLGYGRGGYGSGSDGEGMGSPPRSPHRTSAPAPALAAQQSQGVKHGLPSQHSHQQLQQQQQTAAADRYKQLATRPLTKLEQSILEAAKARHKQGVGAVQTQMGRTFGGDAFLASPTVIDFKDFDMGRTTTLSVQIINRSYKKNTFRVLGIPVEYCDVLDFSYKLPGYLAPGVSGEVAVSFTPKAAVDIDTCLQLLADTGSFEVPIRCRTKRAALSVTPAAVDFGGGVTLGDTDTRTFVLSNDGALEVEYRLDSPQLTDDERAMIKSATFTHGFVDATLAAAAAAATTATLRTGGGVGSSGTLSRARSFASLASAADGAVAPAVAPREERRLTHGGFTVFPCVGTIKGYSKVTFTVTFAPVLPAPTKLVLNFSYKAPSVKRLSLPQHEVVVTGVGRDVPIYLERPVIDFQCCLMGHAYRDVLLVRNGGKTAMKVTVVPRPELEGFFEFSPDFGFVQAGGSIPIAIRFKPTPALLTACRRHLVDPEEDQIIEVPMRLSVPDQTLPVPFSLRAQITHTDLVFEPPSLDFGDCVMAERTALRLIIRNTGRLPQTFGFVGLPSGLRVSPNDGFGHVLPGESLERIVSFQPPIAGPQSFSITSKTLAGRSFTLPCRAVGVSPRLSMSHNRISMPATAVGDTSTVSVVLINRTDAPQAYEFAVPPRSDLIFSPHVGEVPPQTRLRVQIDYCPRPPEEGEEPGAPPPPTDDDGNGPMYDGINSPGSPPRWPGLASPEAATSPPGGVSRDEGNEAAGPGAEGKARGDDSPGRSKRSSSPSAAKGKRKSNDGGKRKSSDGRKGGRASPSQSRKSGKVSEAPTDFNDLPDGADPDGAEYGGSGGAAVSGSAISTLWRRLYGAAASSWYRYREHTITCYIRPQQQQGPGGPPAVAAAAAAATTTATATGAIASSTSAVTTTQELHLQLSTCATLPDLVLYTALPYVGLHRCHCLDFGPVPVGQRVVRTLELSNLGAEVMTLTAEALDSRGVFSNVNALRPVRPGAVFRMLVSFTPHARTQYLETLVVRSARTKLRLALKGAGIAPELQLGPDGVTSNGLDLGDVLVGESGSRTLTVTNVCPFPLSFTMVVIGSGAAADPNLAMRPPFTCHPAEGTLAQGETAEVTVSFSPNSQRPYFADVLQVVVPNQQDELRVPLQGRGWQEGVFVAGTSYPEPDPDPFLLQQLAELVRVPLPPSVGGKQRGGGAVAAAAAAAVAPTAAPAGGTPTASKPNTPAGGSKAAKAAATTAASAAAAAPSEPRVLTLTFPDAVYAGETAKASFEVGSLKSTANGSAPGEVLLQELPAEAREAGWAVADPPAPSGGGAVKVPLAAGELRSITLSYTAPRQPHAGMVAAYGHAEFRTLRLQCTLRGGLVAISGGPEGRSLTIVAKCKLMPGARPGGEPLPPSVTAPPQPVGGAAPPGSAAAGVRKSVAPSAGGSPPASPPVAKRAG